MAMPAPVLPPPVSSFRPRMPFVLASDRDILVGHGVTHTVAVPLGAGLAAAVDDYFRELEPRDRGPRLLVGALPFDPCRPAHLFRPERLERPATSADLASLVAGGTPMVGPARRVEADPPRAAYAASVARALDRLVRSEDGLRKVVLARSLLVAGAEPFDLGRLVSRLLRDPSVTTFLVPLPDDEHGSGGMLIGASPELLLGKSGGRVASFPLAGSARRSADPVADQAAALRLERSEKDRREHAAVVDWVVAQLEPFCARLVVPSGPSLVSTQTMWHLGTRIEGVLRDDGISSVALAAALHPTPAVCGQPTAAAARAIAELESFDRGYFGGAVGWCDGAGDGRWHVTIRCAEIRDTTARLYAGAGIVAGSDPGAETAETSAKFGALLRALGIDEEGRALAAE